jgi:hypothetical protein
VPALKGSIAALYVARLECEEHSAFAPEAVRSTTSGERGGIYGSDGG